MPPARQAYLRIFKRQRPAEFWQGFIQQFTRFKSTRRAAEIRSAKTAETSSALIPSCISPATVECWCCLSSARWFCCRGFKLPRRKPATTIEQTVQDTSTTSSVLLMPSLF